MHFVYILYSTSADKFYIGETKDLVQRLALHNDTSRNSFTSRNGPWKLKKGISVKSRSNARKIETYIKKKKRKAFNQRVIDAQLDELKTIFNQIIDPDDLLEVFSAFPPKELEQ